MPGTLAVLSSALRGAIVAAPGHDLIASDFAAIETRAAAWLARDEDFLAHFRELDACPDADWDTYTWQASQILNREVKKKDKHDRQIWGKVPTLACVYQGAGGALVKYADGMGLTIPRDTADAIVSGWREARQPIVRAWYATQRAAHEAVKRAKYADRTITQDRLRWKVVGRFLHCRLPSGRLLSYLDPRLEIDERFGKPVLKFMGENTYTRKWELCSTYGGKLFENVDQAVCRDLLADAMKRLTEAGYPIVLHVHDEIVAEVPKGFGSVEELEQIMGAVPAWADGFPVAVSGGWIGRRYRK